MPWKKGINTYLDLGDNNIEEIKGFEALSKINLQFHKKIIGLYFTSIKKYLCGNALNKGIKKLVIACFT